MPLMLNVLKELWRPVEKGLKFIGKIQSTILLTAAYVVVGAVAIPVQVVKMFAPKANKRSYWNRRDQEKETVITLRRQF